MAAVEPGERVARHLTAADGGAVVDRGRTVARFGRGRLFVVAVGKAALPMAAATAGVLGERVTAGVIAAPAGRLGGLDARFRVFTAEHPLPGRGSLAAGRAIWGLLGRARAGDDVLVLVSGGASSLVELPAPGLALADVVATTRLLLRSGATIAETNAMRKHLSRIKGGGLARRAAPARVTALLLSDVIGSRPDVIGSGPAAPDRTTFADALAVAVRRRIAERLPARVRRRLERGARGDLRETPKPGELGIRHVVVGDVRTALAAAAAEARRRGWPSHVVTDRLRGEARRAALEVAAALPTRGRGAFLFGGETTVRVTGGGLGGRNQELALALGIAVAGRSEVAALAAGTDGVDGPTDAAGAFADGATIGRARRRGLDAAAFLRRNDAYRFFAPLGDLFRPGPTGTNVADLTIVLVGDQTNARRTRSSSTSSASRRRRAKISPAGSTSWIEPDP